MTNVYRWLFGAKPNLDEQIYDLRAAAKRFGRQQKESIQRSERTRKLCHEAQRTNQLKSARLYAKDCVVERARSLQYQELSSKLMAVSQRLEHAVRMNEVNATMSTITSTMMGALKNLDLEKITSTMNQFEANFGQLDKTLSVTDGALDVATATTVNEFELNEVMEEGADVASMEVTDQFVAAPQRSLRPALKDKEKVVDVAADLEARLQRLSAY